MIEMKELEVFEAPLRGISLVEASAGTGKTYNITSLYVRAILELQLQPSQILVMTFTEAATAELKQRLRQRMREALEAVKGNYNGEDDFLKQLGDKSYPNAAERLTESINSFDEASLFTIHGFCNRLLSEYGLEFDVPAEFQLLTDESELLQDCVDDYWRKFIRKDLDTEEEYQLLDFLTDEGFGPDELMPAVRAAIGQSYVQLEPSEPGLDILMEKLGKLNQEHRKAAKAWEEEKEEFERLLFGKKFNGQKFQKNYWDHDLQMLNEWMKQDPVKISLPKRLDKYGQYFLENAETKSNPIPDFGFEFPKYIEAFVELSHELKQLKPAFVISSIEHIKADFESVKRTRNILSYNDLIESVDEGFMSGGDRLARKISKKYPLALVDEFQDTDPIQYSIFRQLYYQREDTALFMIGDPKQAIYGFRGADIYTYLQARNDAHAGQAYSLQHNYRSNPNMIAAVNQLFSLSAQPFRIKNLEFQQVRHPGEKEGDMYLANEFGEKVNPLQCMIMDNGYSNKSELNKQIVHHLCDEVQRLLNGDFHLQKSDGTTRKVEEKDIAILIRTSRQGDAIQDGLRARGIHSVLKSKTSVFETRQADELFLLLKAIQKPGYEPGIRAALATSMMGYKAEEIIALLEDEAAWSELIEGFLSLKDTWHHKGIEALCNRLFHHFEVLKNLADYPDAERRITNLYHLSDLLSGAEKELKLSGKTLLKWFFNRQQEDSVNAEEEQLRLESDEDLVQISTMHSAKGLQFPIVFCPFLWTPPKKVWRSRSPIRFYKNGQNCLDVLPKVKHDKRKEFDKLYYEEARTEDVRLAYVALTRSISACYVTLPNFKEVGDSALASIVKGTSKDKVGFEGIHQSVATCEAVECRQPVPLDKRLRNITPKTKQSLQPAKVFKRDNVFHYPRMLSYSSLYGHQDQAQQLEEHDYDVSDEPKQPVKRSYDPFGFPRGAQAGTCLHKIFEDIEFSNPDTVPAAVADNLEYHGFDEVWGPPVQAWVKNILDHKLNENGVTLSQLDQESVLKEMEFYFPVQNLQPKKLWEIIRGTEPGFSDLEAVSGFMKGFVDLIFEAEGKYYILDYKSNHLGDEFADYTGEKLQLEMMAAGYDLQYHIYTLALHRYLSVRMRDYDYEKHFGGVFYLFMRGVEPGSTGSGVYVDKPDAELVQAMDAYLKQGEAL